MLKASPYVKVNQKVIIKGGPKMSGNGSKKQESYHMHPIGYVRRLEDEIQLQILDPYRPGLKQLEHFSHVMVLWWADQMDTEEFRSMMQCKPPYAEEHLTGVFATRAEYRPNPVALTTCKILAVDEQEGILTVANIDAYDGTPIVDLKAYFPVCDRVQEVRIPAWLREWPDWMPDEGLGFYEEIEEAETV
jgi:tRNA-Thr(GGU) m(6)t(6)A37 methyltransferase TsaA